MPDRFLSRVRRRDLLLGALGGAALTMCREQSPAPLAADQKRVPMETKSARLPAVFVGHGSPMNAIEDNRWSHAFRELGATLPTPRAVLAVSAHWFVPGTY